MHIIFGGAFNGKRAYVNDMLKHTTKKIYLLEGAISQQRSFSRDDIVVLDRLEQLVLNRLPGDEMVIAKEIFQEIQMITAQAEVICICTDMSRGIVPIDKEQRQLRDTLGRLYQMLFASADTITRIWYGIPQTIKGTVK